CPSDDRENIVAAIATENPIELDAKQLGSTHAKRSGHRVGVLLQPGLNDPPDCRLHLRRALVRILIRIELAELLDALRLLARDVAFHFGDVWADGRHGGGFSGQGSGIDSLKFHSKQTAAMLCVAGILAMRIQRNVYSDSKFTSGQKQFRWQIVILNYYIATLH